MTHHAAKLGGRHRSSVVELSIRNPARPAHASAGRCVSNELGEASDDERSPETASLAPPLAPLLRAGESCRLERFSSSKARAARSSGASGKLLRSYLYGHLLDRDTDLLGDGSPDVHPLDIRLDADEKRVPSA